MLDQIRTEEKIFYHFKDTNLLCQALVHSSYSPFGRDRSLPSQEVLEFLGDSVLGLAISDILIKRNPTLKEGELSRLKGFLVSKKSLSHLAKVLDLGEHILLGKGETSSGGRNKESILVITYEAILGAIYLDSGFDQTLKVVERHFFSIYEDLCSDKIDEIDYKSELQQYSQRKFKVPPQYILLKEEKGKNGNIFETKVLIKDGLSAQGKGKSKKEAETEAAQTLFEQLINLKE